MDILNECLSGSFMSKIPLASKFLRQQNLLKTMI